jgi:hypothetical protein
MWDYGGQSDHGSSEYFGFPCEQDSTIAAFLLIYPRWYRILKIITFHQITHLKKSSYLWQCVIFHSMLVLGGSTNYAIPAFFYTLSNLLFTIISMNAIYFELLKTLLTYFMEQSPSCDANWFVASQEIPRVLLNPKVHYLIHNCLPPVSILSQPNPAEKNF